MTEAAACSMISADELAAMLVLPMQKVTLMGLDFGMHKVT